MRREYSLCLGFDSICNGTLSLGAMPTEIASATESTVPSYRAPIPGRFRAWPRTARVVSREIREHRGSPLGPPPRVGTEVLEGGAPLAVFCVVIVLLAAFPSGPVHAAEAERKPVPDKVIRDEARKFLGQIVELKPQSRSEAQAGAQRLLEKAQEVKAGSDDRL